MDQPTIHQVYGFLVCINIIHGTYGRSPCDTITTTVDCTGKSLHHIPRNLSEKTTILKLRGNTIRNVSSEEWRFLPNLLQLDLSFNHLSGLAGGVFVGLGKLETLDLRGNRLLFHPAHTNMDMFRGLDNLKVLKMEGRGRKYRGIIYRRPPFGIFTYVTTLEQLTFKGWPNGSRTHAMVAIPTAISVLTNLRHFTLDGGVFEEIYKESLEALRELPISTLAIQSTSLRYVGPGTFDDFPYLTTVNFHYNRRVGLENAVHAFSDLQGTPLTSLVLDKCFRERIVTLHATLFCNFIGENIERLTLRGYMMPFLDRTYYMCFKKLKVLSVSYSLLLYISEFDQVLVNFEHNNVHFYMNRLFPDTLEILEMNNLLQVGDAYTERFRQCTRSVFTSCDLETEDFFPKPMTVEPPSWDDDESSLYVKTVSNYSNPSNAGNTTVVHDGFNAYKDQSKTQLAHKTPALSVTLPRNLQFLHATNIDTVFNIKPLAHKFRHISVLQGDSLRGINVSGFRMPVPLFEGDKTTMVGVGNLRIADYSHMGLEGTTFYQVNLTSLRSLNLSHNKLGANPGSLDVIGHADRLTTLDVSHNRLTEIPTSLLHSLPNLDTLDLSYNQLNITSALAVITLREIR